MKENGEQEESQEHAQPLLIQMKTTLYNLALPTDILNEDSSDPDSRT